MNYSISASNWWANRLVQVDRTRKRLFASILRKEVTEVATAYGHCKLSTETGSDGILQKVLAACGIPADKAPFGVSMEIWPTQIQVCYNGGRKETVFKV